MIDLTVVLPVQNQAEIIVPVFRQIVNTIKKLKINYESVLVENGSTDQTWQALNKLKRQYKYTSIITAPKGYGSAILAGLRISQAKYVCYLPSDGQVDLTVLPALWQLSQTGNWDLVKIKRTTRESIVRTLVSFIFSALVSLLFAIPFWDINGSPRIFLRKWVPILDLYYTDSFIDAEFAVKAHHLNWRIKEIPMLTLPRFGGRSTRSWKTFFEFFRNLWHFRTSSRLDNWQRNLKV